MAEKFFLNPFAVSGTKTTIPEAAQPDGSVSYTEGFPLDYQLDQATDPDAKDIPRGSFNELIYETQFAIRQLQTVSAPSFITSAANGGSPFSYARSVRVQWTDGKIYQSLIAANTTDPSNTTNWAEVLPSVTIPDASTTVKGIIEIATPAETIAGTDTVRAVTSQGLAAFNNLAANGYYTHPKNYTRQWEILTGITLTEANTYAVTFPLAFLNACVHIDITFEMATNYPSNSNVSPVVVSGTRTPTGFSFIPDQVSGSMTGNAMWEATGY